METGSEPDDRPPTNGARAVRLGATELWLLATGAVWWPEERTLFCSDLHLGRAPGDDPTPEAAERAARADLGRLGALADALGAERTVCLGDLRHARAPALAAADAVLGEWGPGRPDPALLLVRGNQDVDAGDPPRAWGVETVAPGVRLGPLRLHHHPPEADAEDGPWIAGHLHPGRRVHSGDGPALPAFLLEGRGLVLPAFGAGTRAHPPRRRPHQHLCTVRDGRVGAPEAVAPRR